jgi:hypothetical protein
MPPSLLQTDQVLQLEITNGLIGDNLLLSNPQHGKKMNQSSGASDDPAVGITPIFIPSSTATLWDSPRRPFFRPDNT